MPGYYYTNQYPMDPLEGMYPPIYNILTPRVRIKADEMIGHYGIGFHPTHEMIEEAIEDMYHDVEHEVQGAYGDEHQYRIFGGAPLLRGILGAALISALIRRRRPYYPRPYGYGPHYYGPHYF